MIIVTGGAGLIGSAIVWALNERGESDVLVVDDIDHDQKERNVGHLRYERLVGIAAFREQLQAGDIAPSEVDAIIHMGACSDTTEQDWEYLADNNVAYTKEVIRWCHDNDVRCIYASSAATYGDGSQGFSDDHEIFDQLEPLNLYGKSKLDVDIWARDGGYLNSVVGLRYFNIFGPNEWHKEHLRSVVCKKFDELQAEGVIRLFKSEHPDYADGEQDRDFMYVKDAVAATLHFLEQREYSGVFNVGTGKAGTWNEVATAMFAAVDAKPNIEYIALPDNLKEQYQYHTEAETGKLEATGFTGPQYTLTEAVREYIQDHLLPDKHLGEA